MKEINPMKFRLSIAAIFATSLMLFALVYFIVDRISQTQNHAAQKPRPVQKFTVVQKKPEFNMASDKNTKSLIQAVAALSEKDLGDEFSRLGERLKKENLFNKLEQGTLDALQKAEAKALIERYTLLGLEGTRRKYLPLEPELKDAVYAHRDSLKDIRQLIDQY